MARDTNTLRIAVPRPEPTSQPRGFLDDELMTNSLGAARGGILNAQEASQGDFQDLAREQTSLLGELAAPGQARARSSLEARLLSQGRLGGSSGALEQQAQQEAFSRAGLEAQLAGQGLARQERQDQFGMGLNLAQFGAGLSGQEAGFGLEKEGLDIQRARIAFEEAEAKRARESGGGFLSNLISGVAPAIGAAFGSPLGATAGNAFGSLFSGGSSDGAR